MKTIHEIKLADGTVGTRTSTSRTYGACLVATATERTREIELAEREEWRKELEALRPELAARLAATGLPDVEAARAKHEAESELWYDGNDELPAYFDLVRELRREIEARTGRRWADVPDSKAKAEMIRRGHVDPYAKDGPWGVVEAADRISTLERKLAADLTPVGTARVVSWHRDAGLAAKAAGSSEPGWLGTSRGFDVRVRTDIETTVKLSKKEKAAAAAKESGE